jgi:hypothetical protein
VAYNEQWDGILDIVRILLPLKDSKSMEWLSMFLSHSPPSKSRETARLKLAEISGREDLIAYAKKIRDKYIGPEGEIWTFEEGVPRQRPGP